jgi:hypothetical protein
VVVLLEELFNFLCCWALLQKAMFLLFLWFFNVLKAILGHCWGQETAYIDPARIGVGLPILSVSGFNYLCQGLQRALGLLWVILGASWVSTSFKIAPTWLQDGQRRLQDGQR